MFVEEFQRPFAADSIAEEHRHKVDHFIVTEATAGKAHLLAESIEDALLPQVLDDQHHFAKPGGRRGDRLARSLDDH